MNYQIRDYLLRQSPLKKSKQILILTNLIPLFGVIFWEWSLFGIMVLYWFENVIIGIFNLLKMYRAEMIVDPKRLSRKKIYSEEQTGVSRWTLMIFFFFHYSLFTIVHGSFVFIIFGPSDLDLFSFAAGVIPLLISHIVSYRTNYIGHEEYRKIPVASLFSRPYARITALHVSILAGGFMIQFFHGMTVLSLVILILFKIAMDINTHANEHRNYMPVAPQAPPSTA